LTGNDYVKSTAARSLMGKTIGIAVETDLYQPISNLMGEKTGQMEQAGAKLVYLNHLITDYYTWIAHETNARFTMADGFNEYILGTSGPVRSFFDLAVSSGRIMDLSERLEYLNNSEQFYSSYMQNRKGEYEKYIANIFETHGLDAIVFPTAKHKVFTLDDTIDTDSPGMVIASVIGYPAVSMPMGFDPDGLPYGMEFLGMKNKEASLFEVISGYEALDRTVHVPSHAPSLFDVPEAVDLLVKNHQFLISLRSPNMQVQDFISESAAYFRGYPTNERRAEDAEILNLKYEAIDIYAADIADEDIIPEIENDKSNRYIKFFLYALGAIFLLSFLMICIKPFKKLRRRRRRRRRQNR